MAGERPPIASFYDKMSATCNNSTIIDFSSYENSLATKFSDIV